MGTHSPFQAIHWSQAWHLPAEPPQGTSGHISPFRPPRWSAHSLCSVMAQAKRCPLALLPTPSACHPRPLLALWSPNTLNSLCFMHLLLLFYIGFSALRSFRGCFLPINSLSVLMRPSLKGLLLWSCPLPTRLHTKAPYCVFLKVVGLKRWRSVICSCIYFWLLHGTQWEQVPHLRVWGHVTVIRSRRESLGDFANVTPLRLHDIFLGRREYKVTRDKSLPLRKWQSRGVTLGNVMWVETDRGSCAWVS